MPETRQPKMMVTPYHVAVFNYLSEMVFALLPADPLSNIIKRQLLILRGSQVGEKTKFGRNLWIDDYSKLAIGNYVFFNYGCLLQATGGIQIDDYVLFGPGVTVLSANHDIWLGEIMRMSQAVYKPVHIESEAWLAGRCVILPGVTVGRGAVVAAGAVVTKDVPPYTVVGGVPARIIEKRREPGNDER